MNRNRFSPSCLIVSGLAMVLAGGVSAHGGAHEGPVGQWFFWPQYSLDRNAENRPGGAAPPPRDAFERVDHPAPPLLFHGQAPTDRHRRLLADEHVPRGAFSLEMWVCYHVNQPVGAMATVKGTRYGDPFAWVLGFQGRDVSFTLSPADAASRPSVGVVLDRDDAFKRYWYQLVGVFDGQTATLFVNGRAQGTVRVGEAGLTVPDSPEFELAAYLENEPFMQLGNLVKAARVFDRPMTGEEVRAGYEAMRDLVERGVYYPDRFHFTAGPYLQLPTQTSMSLLWETDRPATASIAYGRELPIRDRVTISEARAIQEATIRDLEPGQPYFYRVTVTAEDGETIDSGILTFKTAVADEDAYSFVVIGDPEARPHVNDQLAGMIWDERPDFVVNVGDLTDGGHRPHKFEWNHEYFAGLTQLHSRIPALTVPGNGEGDLYWYKRYHVLPEPEAYYSFRFGNAEFFMLDSNRAREQFKPGGEQYEWLKQALERSTATWKFAAHHHPTFTSDENDYGDTWKQGSALGDVAVRQILELYERHGVDIVFFGHLHTYERSWPILEGKVNQDRGVRYVQAGGAGGNLEDFAPMRSWFKSKTYRGHHYCTVDVHGGTLIFRMFGADGAMRDSFELRKPADGGEAVFGQVAP